MALNPKPAGLSGGNFGPTITVVSAQLTVADRVRLRLREEMHKRKVSQRKLAERVSKITGETWTQPAVYKILNGHVRLTIDDFAAICQALNISSVEQVREQGREFVADLTPSELKMIEAVRTHPELANVVDAFVKALPPKTTPRLPRAIIRARMQRDDG